MYFGIILLIANIVSLCGWYSSAIALVYETFGNNTKVTNVRFLVKSMNKINEKNALKNNKGPSFMVKSNPINMESQIIYCQDRRFSSHNGHSCHRCNKTNSTARNSSYLISVFSLSFDLKFEIPRGSHSSFNGHCRFFACS